MLATNDLLFGRPWCETLGGFGAWLDNAGLQVDRLPAWHEAAPVRVVALPGSLFLERIPRAQLRQFRRMVADGEERARVAPARQLHKMHQARIVAVDVAKVAAWQRREAEHG